MRSARTHTDLDELMRDLMVVGFIGLFAWTAASFFGVISGYLSVVPHATLRFLLAVLILVFARRTYWEIREWRWRRLPPDERSGFANPLWEYASAGDSLSILEDDISVEADVEATTGSSQA